MEYMITTSNEPYQLPVFCTAEIHTITGVTQMFTTGKPHTFVPVYCVNKQYPSSIIHHDSQYFAIIITGITFAM